MEVRWDRWRCGEEGKEGGEVERLSGRDRMYKNGEEGREGGRR